jgi:hypothetical protein
MTIPTVHLNGTSKDELLRQLFDAGSAVQAAMKALGEAAPNGRDYYPQGPSAFTVAQSEHLARMMRLQRVRDELYDMAEKIDA